MCCLFAGFSLQLFFYFFRFVLCSPRPTEVLDAKYESKLSSYVFPTPDEVTARDAYVTAALATLDTLYAAKLATLQDDLAREEYKEKVLLWNSQHQSEFKAWSEWVAAKEAYLAKKEEVASVREARVALDVLGRPLCAVLCSALLLLCVLFGSAVCCSVLCFVRSD